MKKIFVFLGVFLSFCSYSQQSALQFSVTKIDGGTANLSLYSGKKILVITLPVTQSIQADSLLYALDTLSAARAATLQVIAVPSIEDGFTAVIKPQLMQWYRSKLGGQVLITDGLNTHKSSGATQDVLFQWMTKMTQNEVFDIDADGPGYKFFIDGTGNLFGVLRPQSKIWGISVQRTLAMQY